MNHKVAGRHFGRTCNQRKALLRGLVTSLIEHQSIETTLAKAKAIKPITEKLVTISKRNDLHSKRLVMSYLYTRDAVVKLFSEIAPNFSNTNGGYLQIIRNGTRLKDRAPMAIIQFVNYVPKEKNKKKEKK
ncbi:MAG TPA: 50S ribosomal protein L17 [Nitrospirae bacterium]|nr:50S ribosomal protein L17 [Nitrospirota bacterium]